MFKIKSLLKWDEKLEFKIEAFNRVIKNNFTELLSNARECILMCKLMQIELIQIDVHMYA